MLLYRLYPKRCSTVLLIIILSCHFLLIFKQTSSDRPYMHLTPSPPSFLIILSFSPYVHIPFSASPFLSSFLSLIFSLTCLPLTLSAHFFHSIFVPHYLPYFFFLHPSRQLLLFCSLLTHSSFIPPLLPLSLPPSHLNTSHPPTFSLSFSLPSLPLPSQLALSLHTLTNTFRVKSQFSFLFR